jgi:ankyrin repeat protein
MSAPKALLAAIQADDAAAVTALLSGVSADAALASVTVPEGSLEQGGVSCTPLHVAVYGGCWNAARALLDGGADTEARNADGRTALHDSIECGQTKITELLLERGAYVDVCSAAILGRMDRVAELIDADPELVNDRSTQLSPLGWASYGNQAAIAAELIARGARMDDGELLCAASVGHVEVGRLLLEHGADPDEVRAGAGGNALHAAAAMPYTDDSRRFVQLLLDHGVDPAVPSASGLTARQIAEAGARRQAAAETVDCERAYEAVATLLAEAENAAR